MESTLKNMVVTLFVITFAASACVGAVHMITEEPIARAKAEAELASLRNVLPGFDATTESDMTLDDIAVKTYTALHGGEPVGYAVRTATKAGFGGEVQLMVGFDTEGAIRNIVVLEQKETPGLGTKMCDEGNPLLTSFKGKKPAGMVLKVRKDGGDVDALTAATISSRAYTDAVARAYEAYKAVSGNTAADNATEDNTKGESDGE